MADKLAVLGCRSILSQQLLKRSAAAVSCRYSNTLSNKTVEEHRRSGLAHDREQRQERKPFVAAPPGLKNVHPEFLPNPSHYRRDRIKEKLERQDMFRRRAVCPIPEFYVGSIMAVTLADPYASGKTNRFVGICIQRASYGLRAHFTLRNVVDSQGVEVRYDMYNPLIQKVDVLRLEKRLDDELFYLRDAPPEHSTIPFNLEAVSHPPGAPVPINATKIKLGPRPWHERWERKSLKGVQDLGLPERFYEKAKEVAKPWEEYDLMLKYRSSINAVETEDIMSEFAEGFKENERKRRIEKLEKS